MRTPWKSVALLVLATLLLPGCASVAPVAQTCPVLPQAPALVPLGESFQARMRLWLSGSLPTPTDYALPSGNANGGLKR